MINSEKFIFSICLYFDGMYENLENLGYLVLFDYGLI